MKRKLSAAAGSPGTNGGSSSCPDNGYEHKPESTKMGRQRGATSQATANPDIHTGTHEK